jgi:hypothetical protein
MRNRAKGNRANASDRASDAAQAQRSRNRQKAVLPVRVSGIDVDNNSYSDLVHTLDINDTGVRLGAVRSNLKLGSPLTLQYKQHKAEFRVVWVSKRPCGREYHVGLQALLERDLWGLEAEFRTRLQPQAPEQPIAHA